MSRRAGLLGVESHGRQMGDGPLDRQRRSRVVRIGRVRDVEWSDRGASQRREVSPTPDGRPHVGREHPHVGSPAAGDVTIDVVASPSPHLEAVDPDRTRRGLEHLPRPGGLIELATSHLDGRVRGRALHRLTDERRDGGRQSIVVDRDRLDPRDLAVGVERRGLDAQAHRGLVRLGQVAEEAEEPVARPTPMTSSPSPSGRGCPRGRPSSCRVPGEPSPRRRAT